MILAKESQRPMRFNIHICLKMINDTSTYTKLIDKINLIFITIPKRFILLYLYPQQNHLL